MASYRMEVGAPRASQTAKRIEDIGKNAVRARSAFRDIGKVVLKEQDKRWGKGWKKLSPSTREGKARKGQPKTTGVASGALMRSLTVKGAPGQIWEVSNDELRFGTTLVQGHFLDQGRKNQPKRKTIRLTKQGRQQVVEIITDHIMGGSR